MTKILFFCRLAQQQLKVSHETIIIRSMFMSHKFDKNIILKKQN